MPPGMTLALSSPELMQNGGWGAWREIDVWGFKDSKNVKKL